MAIKKNSAMGDLVSAGKEPETEKPASSKPNFKLKSPNNNSQVKTSISIPIDLRNAIESAAQDAGVTTSEAIRQVLSAAFLDD